ncbi:MAG TPA: septal ring lytic transglycosylase RlpA family protein [Pseudolabrys sp.]|nr:septal ring lytic transglycosylase RlpA family protein [Pseudolabrys sp.]
MRVGATTELSTATLTRPARARYAAFRMNACTGALRRTAALATALAFLPSLACASQHRSFSGTASYYSPGYHGRVASGSRYDPHKFTAAHRTLPFGTHLKVSCPATGQTVTVVVNDRGPFKRRRVLDLSLSAARALHIIGRGVAKVHAEVQ